MNFYTNWNLFAIHQHLVRILFGLGIKLGPFNVEIGNTWFVVRIYLCSLWIEQNQARVMETFISKVNRLNLEMCFEQ